MRPNRHARRRAAALGRQIVGTAQPPRRVGYIGRLVVATGWLPRGTHRVVCEHAEGCAMRSGGQCSCVPEISISGPDGVTVIDEAGNPLKVTRQ
jgi:hypothetical protein